MDKCFIEKTCFGVTYSILQFIEVLVLNDIMMLSSWIIFDAEISGSISKEFIDSFNLVSITDLERIPDYIEHNRNLKESLGLDLVIYGNLPGTQKGCGIKDKSNLISVKSIDD